MNQVYLGLGSNLDDRLAYLYAAKKLIETTIGSIVQCSGIYETEPWGYTDDKQYLNQVILVECKSEVLETLKHITEIEKQLGRSRNGNGYAARNIDIDILFFNSEIINLPELVIPHPKIENRLFVLTPMAELNPAFVHPVIGLPIAQLLEKCEDVCKVKLFGA